MSPERPERRLKSGALAVVGWSDGGCGRGGEANEFGDGVVGEVGDPHVAGAVYGYASRGADAVGGVAGGWGYGCSGGGEGRDGIVIAVGDPDTI